MTGVLRDLFGHACRHRREVLLIGIALVVDVGYYAVLPVVFKHVVDEVVGQQRTHVLLLLLGGAAAAVLVAGAVGVWRDRLYAQLNRLVTGDLRRRMFDRLLDLGTDVLVRHDASDVLARFSGDLVGVREALTLTLPSVLICAGVLLVNGVLLTALAPQLMAVAALGLPLVVVGPRVFSARAGAGAYALAGEDAGAMEVVQDSLRAMPAVKAFGLGAARRALLEERLAGAMRAETSFALHGSLVARLPVVGVTLTEVAVLGCGAVMAFRGDITVGTLAAAFALVDSMAACVTEMSTALPALLSSQGGLQRVDDLLSMPDVVTDGPDPAVAPPPRGAIVLDDVALRRADVTIFDGMSVRIPHGQTTTLVGTSGSGKSTILRLLLRFADPDRGSVTCDGTDLRAWTQDSWRSHIGVVFQEPFLLSASIRDNILAGRVDADDEDVIRCAQAAGVHDMIQALPHGYDTILKGGDGGLSGGQRQRIAIARALLRDPAILLLDEATSGLDAETERSVNEAIARVSRGRTVVAVTHRLQSARNSDVVVVLDGGGVAQVGDHASLTQDENGLYRRLWDSQDGLELAVDGAGISIERLRRIPLFTTVTDEVATLLVEGFETDRRAADRRVIIQGDPGDRFYVVVRGQLTVTRSGPDGELLVGVLRDGDTFGEIALLSDRPRASTVTTMVPTVLLSLTRARFHEVLDRDPDLRARVTAVMDGHLARRDDASADTALTSRRSMD